MLPRIETAAAALRLYKNSTKSYQVTYQVRPHLIHELEPDEAIGPSGHLVHEEAHLVATKFVQIILEDVDTG